MGPGSGSSANPKFFFTPTVISLLHLKKV